MKKGDEIEFYNDIKGKRYVVCGPGTAMRTWIVMDQDGKRTVATDSSAFVVVQEG